MYTYEIAGGNETWKYNYAPKGGEVKRSADMGASLHSLCPNWRDVVCLCLIFDFRITPLFRRIDGTVTHINKVCLSVKQTRS